MLGSVRELGCGAGRVRSRPSIASQAVPQVESWQLGATLLVPGFACHSGRKLPSVFHLPPLLLAPNQSSRAGFPFPPPPFVPTHWNALWAGRPLKPLSNPEPLETYSSHLSAAGCLPFLSLPRPPTPPPPAPPSPLPPAPLPSPRPPLPKSNFTSVNSHSSYSAPFRQPPGFLLCMHTTLITLH